MSQLALSLPPAPPHTDVRAARRLRGVLSWDSEPMARAWLARHGEYHRNPRGVLMRVRPRVTRRGVMLVAWWSGYPWALGRDKVLKQWRAEDVQ